MVNPTPKSLTIHCVLLSIANVHAALSAARHHAKVNHIASRQRTSLPVHVRPVPVDRLACDVREIGTIAAAGRHAGALKAHTVHLRIGGGRNGHGEAALIHHHSGRSVLLVLLLVLLLMMPRHQAEHIEMAVAKRMGVTGCADDEEEDEH